jgi:hypothetical protein
MDRLGARLESRSLVKFILGLTNFDRAEIDFLTRVYTLAGVDVIDIAADVGTVVATRGAIAAVRDEVPAAADAPAVMVSVALAHDPHIEGVRLDPEHLASVAPATPSQLTAIVAACLAEGAEMVEVHASDSDDAALVAALEAVSPVLGDRYLSVCLGTQGLRSPQDAIRQARLARAIHGSHTMIQAEGLAAAGRAHPSSSLQGLALAQALLAHTPAYVLVAGAANHWTRSLADVLGVAVHGVASGTYARALVKGMQASDPHGDEWEPVAAVARAFVGQLRGGGARDV